MDHPRQGPGICECQCQDLGTADSDGLFATVYNPSDFRWPLALPDNWPTEPGPHAVHDDLPICLLRLPTYASWLNPIEKLWRWLKQEVLHMHRLADQWPVLRQRVNRFLDCFDKRSPDLLHYVGLLPY